MNSKIYKIIFVIIWFLFCLAAFFTISDSDSPYNYIFYIAIGMFVLVGVVFLVYALKNPKEEEVEGFGNDKLEELKEKHSVVNKVENAVLFVKGLRFIVAGTISGLVALVEILFFILGLSSDKKIGEMLFDIIGILMFSFGCVVFLYGGIKNIKLSKNNKNNDNNM